MDGLEVVSSAPALVRPAPAVVTAGAHHILARRLWSWAKREEAVAVAQLAGLAENYGSSKFFYRVKERESLQRKLLERQDRDPRTVDSQIRDLIGCTMVFDGALLVTSATGVLDSAKLLGYRVPTNPRNYFVNENRYVGLHANLETPTGLPIEVQFHTPASLRVKLITDDMYHLVRNRQVSPRARAAALEFSMRLTAAVALPVDAWAIGDLTGKRSPGSNR